MKQLLKWFGLFGLVLVLSCKSAGPVSPTIPVETKNDTKVEKVITSVERDTIIQTVADSTFYRAWVECLNGKPVLKQSQSKPGRHLTAPQVTLDDNGQLQIKVKALAEELFFKWKEQHVNTTTTNSKTTQVLVPVERDLSTWETAQIYLGRLFLGIITLALAAWIIKKRKSN